MSTAVDAYFRPYSHVRLGELYEAKGDAARAIAEYTTFLDLWRHAEPAQQGKVQDIRERVARLNAAKG